MSYTDVQVGSKYGEYINKTDNMSQIQHSRHWKDARYSQDYASGDQQVLVDPMLGVWLVEMKTSSLACWSTEQKPRASMITRRRLCPVQKGQEIHRLFKI